MSENRRPFAVQLFYNSADFAEEMATDIRELGYQVTLVAPIISVDGTIDNWAITQQFYIEVPCATQDECRSVYDHLRSEGHMCHMVESTIK